MNILFEPSRSARLLAMKEHLPGRLPRSVSLLVGKTHARWEITGKHKHGEKKNNRFFFQTVINMGFSSA